MKKYINGKCIELTPAEISAMKAEQTKAELMEKSRPLSADEINHLFIAQNINTVITDDKTASRAVEFHPVLKQDGALIPHGTRINWHGQLKRAAVDLWDTSENNPNNAPALWEDINYRDGFRMIPETITAGTAFTNGEYGWWGKILYQSTTDNNVWTPELAPTLWLCIDKIYDGTIDSPISYSGNMILENGKYYVQDSIIYLCIKDTVNLVYHPLSELVGIYVEQI